MLRNVYHGARLALSQWGVARRWQSNSTVTGTAESEDRFLVAASRHYGPFSTKNKSHNTSVGILIPELFWTFLGLDTELNQLTFNIAVCVATLYIYLQLRASQNSSIGKIAFSTRNRKIANSAPVRHIALR